MSTLGVRAVLSKPRNVQNVALAVNGGVASASTSFPGFGPSGLNNNIITTGWGSGLGGGWAADAGSPQWARIDFNKSYKIHNIYIHSRGSLSDTPEFVTTNGDAIVDFTISYWDGTAFRVFPGGSFSGNNKSWVALPVYPYIETSAVRVDITVNGGAGGNPVARIHELQVYGS